MILVDTSVWIDHLREGNRVLAKLLTDGDVLCHPFIIGEVACGHLRQRREIIALLHTLPSLDRVSDDEALFFIEKHRLYGKGIGLIDIHLLASCSIGSCQLWTKDKRLLRIADNMGISI
ncbi:MAG: PIN domain-containing protein [Verrucomicrobia bacterium]|nr:PIN domain-containing protein [Kiritimatiellia bacterium]MCO6400407.1 PIN domain-containing protein [Verrucomicrobiota bacterium]